MTPINVLSLFDGISCGRIALDRAKIPVKSYTAYEIMPAALTVSQANYPDIVHKGDVFDADYTQDPEPDLLIGGSPCFVAGTPVFTAEGIKNIEDIRVGDMVLTHKNRYRKVTAVGSKIADVYAVYAQGVPPFYVTENHPFYVKRTKRENTTQVKRAYSGRQFSEPVWVKVNELTTGDFFGSPILNTVENPYKFDLTTCWLLGRYAATGHLRNVAHTQADKLTTIFEVVDKHDFGDNARTKNIPNLILNLPQEHAEAFLCGYLGVTCGIKTHGTYIVTTASKRLAYTLALLAQKVYETNVAITCDKTKATCTGGDTSYTGNRYVVRIKPSMSKQTVAAVHEGIIWTPYKRTEYVGKDTVYNISVADDESYVANNRIVHNCTYWSCANGKREVTPDGQGGKLFMQYVRALHETKPKYFLYENNASIHKDIKAFITEQLGVAPIEINSALVSAQQRKRCYWTNIPNVKQPEDKHIKLSDILEDVEFINPGAVRGRNLNKAVIVGRRIAEDGHRKDYDRNVPLVQCLEVRSTNTDKSNCLTTVSKDNVLTPLVPGRYPDAYANKLPYRYYTRRECERLQTLPDGYTDAVGDATAKKLIGNGWTVDVIAHILSHIPDEA